MKALLSNLIKKPVNFRSIVGRCHDTDCNSLTILGVCIRCHGAHVCMHCKKVRQPDGTWLEVPFKNSASNHILCEPCFFENYGDVVKFMLGRDCQSVDDLGDKTQKIRVIRHELCHA